MVNNGKVMVDASDPSVLQKAMNERLAKNPNATDADKQKMQAQATQMQTTYSKIMATYNADGTTEQATMETVSTQKENIKATYTLDEATGQLQLVRPDVKDMPSKVSIKDGILSQEIPGMGMTFQFKK